MDPISSPTSTSTPGTSSAPTTSPPCNLEQLNEVQLREIYENEEIERFLRLFSTYVEEVKIPGTSEMPSSSVSLNYADSEGEWIRPGNDPQTQSTSFRSQSISEQVAYRVLLPYLLPRAPPQEFTLNRFRLAGQRLYLAIVPHYLPFIVRSYRLAKWEDWKKSSTLCAAFWFFWWHDLLPAAFFFNLLFALFKHRFFPYPSLSELKQHRDEIHDADRFGEQLSRRLSTASFGVRDIWRLCRLVAFSPKEKKYPGKNKTRPQSSNCPSTEGIDESTVLEDPNDSEEVQQFKRLSLFLMNEAADLHERIRNIFIWRKPASSWLYSCFLAILFLAALFTPVRYISKIFFGAMGFLYWHVTPVIVALPPEDRLRLPAPLSDVPNDSEYAMEMISGRVAAGLEISPSKFAKEARISHPDPPPYPENEQNLTAIRERSNAKGNQPRDISRHLKRMGRALDSGKSLLHDGKRFITKIPDDESLPRRSAMNGIPTYSVPIQSLPYTPISTPYIAFPAQHSSAPGLITLTSTKLYFTSLISLDPSVTVSLQDIKGVKKVGILKGLDILLTTADADGGKSDKLEKFIWVNNRDELFARIISINNNVKWMKV